VHVGVVAILVHSVLQDEGCFTTTVVFCAVGCGVFATGARERGGYMGHIMASKVGAAVFWARRFWHHSFMAFKGKVAGPPRERRTYLISKSTGRRGLTTGCDGAWFSRGFTAWAGMAIGWFRLL